MNLYLFSEVSKSHFDSSKDMFEDSTPEEEMEVVEENSHSQKPSPTF